MRDLIILTFLIISFQLFAQNEDFLKIENGISIIENDRDVSCLLFSTDQDYTKFYKALIKKIGEPEFEGYTAVFDSINISWWSRELIIIRYEVISVEGFEDSWKTIFIMAETHSEIDLLKPGTKSEKRIKRYLRRKIRRYFN